MITMRRLLVRALLLPVMLSAVSASAQQPAPKANEGTEKTVHDNAKRIFDEGIKSEKDGDWERAYSSYIVAFRLWRHFDISANLGGAELHLGKYRDAAEHIAFSLRRVSQEPTLQNERAKLEEQLIEAKKHIGSLTIQVDAPGADILVDGKSVGRSPLDATLFVEPGTRTIEAQLGDKKSGARTVELEAGSSREVSLKLEGASGSSTASPATRDPSRTSDSTPNLESLRRKSVVPAIFSASLAAVGLTVGIVFSVKAASKEDDREQLVAQLGEPYACGPGSQRPVECAQIKELADDRVSARNIGIAGFVTAGISAAATVYLLWLQPNPSKVAIVPSVSTQHAGINLRTTF